MKDKLVSLIILDGYGINPKKEGNAILSAKKPNLDEIFSKYPTTKIKTSGLDVGLPDGQMGNSEVGHTNIGAGRIVYQELTRITKSIQDGDFFENKEFLGAVENCKKNNSKLHIYGLLSDGGVHSHITHLYGLLELAKKQGLSEVYVHCFLDGRDTAPSSGKGFVEKLQNKMKEIGVGKIATVSGRFYAMDRDNRWERVVLAYNAMVLGEGQEATSAVQAVEDSYSRQEFDEFVKPTVIKENGKPIAKIEKGDSIIFYNYRPDRAREITRALVDENFTGFERKMDILNCIMFV